MAVNATGVFFGCKRAVQQMITRQVAADYARSGIVCNAIAPGKIVTGTEGHSFDEKRQAYSVSRPPWPRLGRPQHIASTAVFLASVEATYITGHNLMVDGGWMNCCCGHTNQITMTASAITAPTVETVRI